MCKILCIDKKTEQKKTSYPKVLNKKLILSKLNEILPRNIIVPIDNVPQNTQNDERINDKYDLYDQTNLLTKREKSRIAAKNRRNQENENLSELYISLPVATQSKLLSCYDNQFIGNFEKTTIIKISAYVLKLYNSLSNLLYDNSYHNDKHPLVSLFSQSIFGLFWCDKSSKLVFSSPGLARLTGLYWCNMIGMPHGSIIDETGNNESSNIIFLRFMMGALKDRGIFTVNPWKSGLNKRSDEIKSEKSSTSGTQTKRDFIGKLPCSVWCSRKISNDISFILIQPLMVRPQLSGHGCKVDQSHQSFPYRLPVSSNTLYNMDKQKRAVQKITTIHDLNSLATISIYGDTYITLGYKEDQFSRSNLLSFFHCDDIVRVSKEVNELLSGRKKIQLGIGRLCTPKSDFYRWSRYILQINTNKDIKETNTKCQRPSMTQGESFSQNIGQIIMNNNNDNNSQDKSDFSEMSDESQYSCLQATFLLCHYFKDHQPDYANNFTRDAIRRKTNSTICSNSSNLSSNQSVKYLFPPSHKNLFEKPKWFNGFSVRDCDLNINKQMFSSDISQMMPYYPKLYQEKESILLNELMRPVPNLGA